MKRWVRLAKLRWRVERDYQEMKGEVGLDHFEGRSWRGFHHHATLCMVAHGFLSMHRALSPGAGRNGRCRRCGGSSNSCCCAASATVPCACVGSTRARLLVGRHACDRVVLVTQGGHFRCRSTRASASPSRRLAVADCRGDSSCESCLSR